MAVSLALFALATTFIKVSAHTITSTFGAVAFGIFYWYVAGQLEPATWPLRAAAIALAAVWLVRTWRKEKPFLAQAAAPIAGAGNNAAARSIATNRAVKSGAPEVHFVPEDKVVAAKDGLSLLEIAESNGMTIESGCRMGICGADPVAIKDGMECLSGISDDEKATLERLGLAPNTRMACCARVQGPVTVSLKPDKASAPSMSKVAGLRLRPVRRQGRRDRQRDRGRDRRRPHPPPAPADGIDLIAEEPHHLYNRMGIARLVYGKSAMQGLYLNPDTWYGDRKSRCG